MLKINLQTADNQKILFFELKLKTPKNRKKTRIFNQNVEE